MSHDGSQAPDRTRVPALVVFAVFLRLGLTSFGGPLAHIGYFSRAFVEKRRWLSAADFTELVALCHFLPGPASSQTGFAIGLSKAGLAGGVAAFTGFTLPSALLMLAAAYGVVLLSGPSLPAIVHGLNLVAVSVVAQAVVLMARSNLRSAATAALAVLSLGIALTAGPYAPPFIIAAAAATGLVLPAPAASPSPPAAGPTHLRLSIGVFCMVLVLLAALPALRQLFPDPMLATADGFYRTGALVFGGGHVVLPLIEAEMAGRISHPDFLAGYGAAQALPGPLFSFAAYAGALGAPAPPDPWLGLVALAAIFLPGFLLVGAALPVWTHLRANPRAARLVAFAGAAVVGVLAAAWWNPVAVTAIRTPVDAIIALIGFGLLLVPRIPTLAAVALIAAAGAAAHAL